MYLLIVLDRTSYPEKILFAGLNERFETFSLNVERAPEWTGDVVRFHHVAFGINLLRRLLSPVFVQLLRFRLQSLQAFPALRTC